MPSSAATALDKCALGHQRVVIIGGGLAGIAAATALAEHAGEVVLCEARRQLGGRAGSYVDANTGEIIDNCQHVNMGCCTNLQQLSRHLGIDDHFHVAPQLNFIGPDGSLTPFRDDPLPAPLHLTRSFLRLPYLSWREKISFALAVRALARAGVEQLTGMSFADWLRQQRQSERVIKRVWEVVLVSALSESLERIDAAYARKVFVDGFLRNRSGWRVEIPDTSLDDLYSAQTAPALEQQGVRLLLNHRLRSLHGSLGGLTSAEFQDGTRLDADEFILAVPQHQVASLLPEDCRMHPSIAALEQIESAPITSVHLWLSEELTTLPHAVFVDRDSQWLFARGRTTLESGERAFRYQVVISASRNLSQLSPTAIGERITGDLFEIFRASEACRLLHARVISERRAVFSVTPGIDALRPPQQSCIPNLQLAGDWTQTGWPATMEGAVRSGYLAASNLLRKSYIERRILAPDLPTAWLARWSLGLGCSE